MNSLSIQTGSDISRETADNRRLKVAILDEELPFPLNSGKRIRTFNLISRLANRHRITYICHRSADSEEGRNALRRFSELGVETVIVDRSIRGKTGPMFYGSLLRNLFSPHPYSVTSHDSLPFRKVVQEVQRRTSPDLWLCEWTPYAVYADLFEQAPWMVMAHNVESLIWKRYYLTEKNPLKKWYIKKQWHKYEAFERSVYFATDRLLTVSPEDADLARREFRSERCAVVENGVDIDYFQPGKIEKKQYQLLFLGSLDWRPNQDAVRWFVEDIFPAIRALEPRAVFCIVGRKPPQWMKSLSDDHLGVEIHADVPDVRPYIHQSTAMVVPLRVGGGSRLKILESLACELPVISTSIGAEGLELAHDRELIIADSAGDFTQSVLNSLRYSDRLRDMGNQGRSVVLEKYSWDRLAEKMHLQWLDCVRCGKHG